MNLLLPLLGLGAVGLAVMRKKAPVLGSPATPTSTGSTVVRGPVTGTNYMVGLGIPAEDGRQVLSIYTAEGTLLLTVLATPGSNSKLFLARSPGTDDAEISAAMSDFAVTVP